MDVFATRALSYTDENGMEGEVILTVFMPFEVEGDWKCRSVFDPCVVRWDIEPSGGDFLGAFESSLTIAFIFFKTSELYGRTHWRGMIDCGLPEHSKEPVSWGLAEIPAPEHSVNAMDILATRRLGCPDESGVQTELLLTVFVPFKEGEIWKCGITFGPPLSTGVYYGVGEDLIEALLDALALARVVYERKVPEGWASGELHSCFDFPYKVGRSFRIDPAPEVPGMPDRSAE